MVTRKYCTDWQVDTVLRSQVTLLSFVSTVSQKNLTTTSFFWKMTWQTSSCVMLNLYRLIKGLKLLAWHAKAVMAGMVWQKTEQTPSLWILVLYAYKVVHMHTVHAYGEVGSSAPCILNLDTRCRSVVSLTRCACTVKSNSTETVYVQAWAFRNENDSGHQ